MGLQIVENLNPVNSITISNTIMQIYHVIEPHFPNNPQWKRMDEEKLWNHLCLCILSSNVSYELAKSAIFQLAKTGLLDPSHIISTSTSKDNIENELTKPVYLPEKKDGTLRKYRFPSIRAKNIVNAAFFIYSGGNTLKNILKNANSEESLRNHLADNVDGLGLKESSHFLRNVSYSSKLAIIDVHIISFMKEWRLISSDKITLTPKIYFYLEKIMQQISENNGLRLSVLDNAIWQYMRYRVNS